MKDLIRNVIDEECHCGHLRSQHRDTAQAGHGCCAKCDCTKFTWKRFVYELASLPTRGVQ